MSILRTCGFGTGVEVGWANGLGIEIEKGADVGVLAIGGVGVDVLPAGLVGVASDVGIVTVLQPMDATKRNRAKTNGTRRIK